jgi:hypothetical protein
MGGRGHKLQPLFNLTFRRSSIQHPLLAGAMGECAATPARNRSTGVAAGLGPAPDPTPASHLIRPMHTAHAVQAA